jgi:hypothetical protein
MDNNKKSLNWPFIVITAFGIIGTFIITFVFVQGLAINTVKDAILLQKAYPKIKPQEYVNELKLEAEKNHLIIDEIKISDRVIVLQIVSTSLLEKLLNEAPDVSIAAIVNLSIHDIGDGTAIVANNPYIWAKISSSPYLDDIVKNYSNEISLILDSIYWKIKEKKKVLSGE